MNDRRHVVEFDAGERWDKIRDYDVQSKVSLVGISRE